MDTFEIAELWVYPVKSLGGTRVPSTRITAGGSFAGDREWLIVDLEGQMLWQGDLPRMTLLDASVANGTLSLRRRDGESIALATDFSGAHRIIRQYGFEIPAIDGGDRVAQWLSDFLGRLCRLVRIDHHAHAWGGLNPVHIISLSSLQVLNRRMTALGNQTIEIERLRPNIVLAGDHDAFAEECVSSLVFDGTTLTMVEPCVRCELPNISRVDATRQRQPLKLIGAMSRERSTSKPASFGMYGRLAGERLQVGLLSRPAAC